MDIGVILRQHPVHGVDIHVVPLGLRAVIVNILDVPAAAEGSLSDRRHTAVEGDCSEVIAVVKRVLADVSDAVLDHDLIYIVPAAVPRGGAVGIINHIARAGDGQDAVVQAPEQFFAAAAGGLFRLSAGIVGRAARPRPGDRTAVILQHTLGPGIVVLGIVCRGGDAAERGPVDRRRGALEADLRQNAEALERMRADGGDAAIDHELRHAVLIPGPRRGAGHIVVHLAVAIDDQHTVLRHHPVQSAAADAGVAGIVDRSAGERTAAVIDRNAAPLLLRALVEDVLQRSAAERRVSDARHALREHNALQAGAAIERIVSDARYTARNLNVLQVAAVPERIVSDARNTVRNSNVRQASAALKHTIPDTRYTIRDLDALQAAAVPERIVSDAHYTVRNFNACQAGTVIECISSNTRNTVWNVDACQTAAAAEH